VCSTRGDDEVEYPFLFAGEILRGIGVSRLLEEPKVVALLLSVPCVPDAGSTFWLVLSMGWHRQ
jgi:hypothetical protein